MLLRFTCVACGKCRSSMAYMEQPVVCYMLQEHLCRCQQSHGCQKKWHSVQWDFHSQTGTLLVAQQLETPFACKQQKKNNILVVHTTVPMDWTSRPKPYQMCKAKAEVVIVEPCVRIPPDWELDCWVHFHISGTGYRKISSVTTYVCSKIVFCIMNKYKYIQVALLLLFTSAVFEVKDSKGT